MKTKVIRKLLVIGLFFYLPQAAMAWGVLGHRIVGQIADSYLTREAQKEIFKILGTESIAIASNWPDFIKSDPAFAYLSPWHYINLKPGMDEAAVKTYLDSDTATDAYTKINFLVVQLKNKELDHDKQVLYLRLLIHIVGDIHQPLHIGRLDDLGGNKIKVLWFNNPFNLHQVWDEKLIDFQQLSYTEYACNINHTTKTERHEWQGQAVGDWIYQSYQIAEQIYSDIKQPEEKLSYQYNFKYIATLNQQLLKGGVRLAGLLNDIFG